MKECKLSGLLWGYPCWKPRLCLDRSCREDLGIVSEVRNVLTLKDPDTFKPDWKHALVPIIIIITTRLASRCIGQQRSSSTSVCHWPPIAARALNPASPFPDPHSGELRTQKLKSHLVRTQSFNVLPLKPGVGQYIATHATLTAGDFFLAYFYSSGPFTCIFSQNLPRFLLCWLWLTHGSCVGPQNKISQPAGGRFPCWLPAEFK